MYEDFNDYEEEDIKVNHFNINIKYIICGILVIILFFIIYISFFGSKTYHDYEIMLQNAAKKYVKKNDIITYREVYFDNVKLGVDLPSNCANTSGVIHNGNSYIAYLVCSDYESNIINNDSSRIRLIGEDVEVLIKGQAYHELGYISNDNVTITGEVGKEAGIYNLYYMTSNNEIITRKIIIIDSPIPLNAFPSIELVGNSVETVTLNENYNDRGVYAKDIVDGTITMNVIKYGDVNTYNKGEYTIYYTIKNSRGYSSGVTRKVLVVNNQNDINIVSELNNSNMTNESVNIIFNILGNSYEHTILPNGEISYTNNFQYEVKENGIYIFKVVSTSGEIIEKQIEVKNIYKDAPNGTCSAVIYNDRVEITVNATSSISIMGYDYVIDGESTGYRISNEYKKYGIKPSSVYVNVRDITGNETKVTCSIKNETQNTYNNPNGITKTFSGEHLTTPLASALAKKGYTVTDLNMCIYNRVKAIGPGTRYGVMEAGVSLLECTKEMTGYVYSYDYCAAKIEGSSDCRTNPDICGKLGVNTKWGTGSSGGCCRDGGTCYAGFSCAGYVRWALCNGGMNQCNEGTTNGAVTMASNGYLKGGDSFEVYGNTLVYKYGNNLTYLGINNLLHMVQPGDIVRRYRKEDTTGHSEHVMLIVGKDDNYIYYAENGDEIKRVSYSKISDGEFAFQFVLLDNYYANPNNQNNLYR